MKICCVFVLLLLLPSYVGAVRFGAISSYTDVERLEFFTSSQGGGIDIVNQDTYSVYNPYDGMYLWARYDRRLDSLSNILPSEGTIILNCSGTPAWNTGWWFSISLPEGERNQRPINDLCYSNMFGALISRYGTSGVRQPQPGRAITNWSLWGEPDGGMLMVGQQEFLLSPEAAVTGMVEYYKISSLAADRIRTIEPNATIISGSFLSPASSSPGGAPWFQHVRHCLQLCFSGEADPFNPVKFGWPEGPDVFDWHPYDDFEQEDYDWESYYDPLVIDDNDFMYRERCDDLAEAYLDDFFLDSWTEPEWDQIPHYLLEFCPTYTLDRWRTQGEVNVLDFHSEWRANYHITSCLMLAESSHLEVLTPWLAGSGQWWVSMPGASTYECIPMPEALWPSPADLSYQFLTSKLNNTICLSYSSECIGENLERFSSDENTYRLAHWTFGQEEEISPRIHALRTFRDQQFSPFDESLQFNIEFQVPPSVESLEIFTLTGTHTATLIPGNNGIVTIDIDGYILYAIEIIDGRKSDSQTSDLLDNSLNTESEVFRLRLFDLAGRLVVSQRINSLSLLDMNYISPYLSKFALPEGNYFVAIFNENNQMLISRKVLVIK